MKKQKKDIILEKIAPFISWLLITMPIWGGLLIPEITAYLVIFFNIYFLYKSISLTIFVFLSYLNLKRSESINWLNKILEYGNIDTEINKLEIRIKELDAESYDISDEKLRDEDKLNKLIFKRFPRFLKKFAYILSKAKAIRFLKGELKNLKHTKEHPPIYDWKEINHIILIPHMKEPFHVLEDTILRIKEMNYPKDKISIVLASEIADENGYSNSLKLKEKYSKEFANIWITSHKLVEGELVGKSSNMAYASKVVYEEVIKLGWDFKKVTITSCDADSQLPVDYLSNITYLYINNPEGYYKFYTAAVLLYANIWELPFFARVKNSMSTIYNVAKLIRTDKLVPFSTYTTSFWMIKEIGFWSPEIIPEDFHTFSKAMFKYPHKVSTIPIYQRVLSDAAEGEGVIDTIKNNYFQERRWSWGISDDGWLIKNIVKSLIGKQEATLKSIYVAAHIVFDHIAGVGIALLVALGGYIPLLLNKKFANTVFGFNLPNVTSYIINITLLFFVFMIIIDSFLKPAQKGKVSIFKRILYFLEWIVQPITGILMVALPGFEAHTRLLFGKYLEYYLTKKK